MQVSSKVGPKSGHSLKVIRPDGDKRGFWSLVKLANPLQAQSGEARTWRRKNLWSNFKGLAAIAMVKVALAVSKPIFGPTVLVAYSSLVLSIKRADGEIIPLGLASTKLVTDVGVDAIVDGLDSGTMAAFDFQGIGTGTTGAATGDTDIETEITTQYNSDNVRPTGTISQPSSNVFRNLSTIGVDGAVAATEVGVLDNATVGSGTLFDRHVFSVVNLASGDSLQATYDLTISAGG